MKQKPASMTISLPHELRQKLEKGRKQKAYSTTSEYVRELIRKGLQREAIARVDEMLLEGLHSGGPIPVTPEWWKERYAVISKKAAPRRRRRA